MMCHETHDSCHVMCAVCVTELVCCMTCIHLSRASGLSSHLTVDEGGCVTVSVPVCIVRLVPCDCNELISY